MKHWRRVLLVSIMVGSFIAIMFSPPIKQNLEYHNFADTRVFLGIPNFGDVVSNLPLLLFGLIGSIFCWRNRQREAPWSWIFFFVGVSLTCFGSAYYHWNPNNTTLVWDRLPMTIGFMALFVALLTEFVHPQTEKYALALAIVMGFASVVHWHYSDDLRFYYWVQLAPILCIPTILLLFPRKYSHASYFVYALIFYLLAKFAESYDVQVYAFTQQAISGHTLKHLLASCPPLCLYWMLKERHFAETYSYG